MKEATMKKILLAMGVVLVVLAAIGKSVEEREKKENEKKENE